jgi:hypothetical protein
MGSPRTYLVKFTVRAYRTCMVVTIKLPSVWYISRKARTWNVRRFWVSDITNYRVPLSPHSI